MDKELEEALGTLEADAKMLRTEPGPIQDLKRLAEYMEEDAKACRWKNATQDLLDLDRQLARAFEDLYRRRALTVLPASRTAQAESVGAREQRPHGAIGDDVALIRNRLLELYLEGLEACGARIAPAQARF